MKSDRSHSIQNTRFSIRSYIIMVKRFADADKVKLQIFAHGEYLNTGLFIRRKDNLVTCNSGTNEAVTKCQYACSQ